MKLSEFKLIIDRASQYSRQWEDLEVVIQVKLPYSTVGGTPRVAVTNAWSGFDWDAGKFFIIPGEELTPGNRDFAKQMREMQERAGWADSENRRLKAELNQLRKQIAKIKEGAGGKYSDITSDGGMDPRDKSPTSHG